MKIRARFRLTEFIEQHQLPAEFAATAEKFFIPLAQWLQRQASARRGRAYVLGINAAQGAGKSTLAAFLADYLRAQSGSNVATLSIDDIYLPSAERQKLARQVHPLLATRGVPGTHDLQLGERTIRRLQALGEGQVMAIPRFDKLRDDRMPESQWPTVTGPVAVILFEGWCVGSQAVADGELTEPVNELERTRDASGAWRQFVNHELGSRYQALFGLLDALVFMAVPDFDCVRKWRTDQEHKLIAAGNTGHGMNDAQVAEFVQYFERITLQDMAVLPQRADVVLRIGPDHQLVSADYRPE
jgi:D-glycerate 3-kinase